jgi:hypothetical protein
MQSILETSRSTRHPRPYTNPANLAKPTTHATAVYELAPKSKFAKRAIGFANLLSLQTFPAVTTLLGISRAPTSVVRIRAQKKIRSRTQGEGVDNLAKCPLPLTVC